MIIAYVFVEWNEEHDHSVVAGKVVELMDTEKGFIKGADVQCILPEGKFGATIIATGKLCAYHFSGTLMLIVRGQVEIRTILAQALALA